jgi:hypothetical protein
MTKADALRALPDCATEWSEVEDYTTDTVRVACVVADPQGTRSTVEITCAPKEVTKVRARLVTAVKSFHARVCTAA